MVRSMWHRENNSQMSPINIVTGAVHINSSLIPLQFDNQWDVKNNGTFRNIGRRVQFSPAIPATTTNSLGTYVLNNFHMHWGPEKDEGSEHTIDGERAEMEIHFVHTKQGADDITQKDYYAVIAVLAEVDISAPLTGPWEILNVPMVQPINSTEIQVSGIDYNDLLPKNRDYYYYPGSLTAPPCNETVQWFVLKEKITVPRRFLNQLRDVQQTNGSLLTSNFRAIQGLAGRKVMTASQVINKPVTAVFIFSYLFFYYLF